MSVIGLIIDSQSEYYKTHKRPVSMLILDKPMYNKLLRELEKDSLYNLHGMQVIVNSKISFMLI